MLPRLRGTLGCHGVRVRPSGTFYVKIRSDDMRLGLDTFDAADDAARAYDAAAWRLNRPRREMNFPERRECRLSIAEMDEHVMAEWRRQFPQDVLDEREFFAQRRAERRAEQAAYREDRRTRKQAALFLMELKESSTWSSNNERWGDAFITTEESDTDASEPEDDDE
ncbi:Ethylene-responsive transcription factor CRF1 [Hordeum vulgare]|nr:Ethylene-responsive transcription factor CRF1 [Hordeum vulgare]